MVGKKVGLFVLSFLLISGSVFQLSFRSLIPALGVGLESKFSEGEEGEKDEKTGYREALLQEIEMTQDPALGYVPKERLQIARDYIRTLSQTNKVNVAGITWRERGPSNVSGRTRAVLVDPNDPTGNSVFSASVGGGLWKTTNITANPPVWNAVDDMFNNLAVVSLAADPTNNQVMYFGTGEGYLNSDAIRGAGIWKSTNGGTTWTQLPSTTSGTFNYVYKIVITNAGVLLAATSSGLHRSANGGTTWTKVLGNGLGITGAGSNLCYDVDVAANGDVFASLDGSLHKSTNAGVSFGNAIALPVAAGRIEIACAPSDANYVYLLIENGSVLNGVARSTNGGASFTARTEPADADGGIPNTDFSRGQAWYDLCITVDPNNRDRVWAGGIDLFRSNDGCGTWVQQTHWYGGFGFQEVHADQHYIGYRPGSSTEIYFGNDGGVFKSTNANAGAPVIDFKGENYNVTQFYSCAMHPSANTNYFLAGAQDNGSQQFTSPGISTTTEVTGGDGTFCHIDQNQPQYQFTQYVYNEYFRSNNGGANWVSISHGSNGRFVNPTDYDNVGNRLYAARNNNQYLRWDNPQTGNTFTQVAVAAFNGQVSCVRVSENTANRVFFGIGNGDIFRCDNAHTGTPTVTNLSTGLPGGYVSCVEVELGNDNHLLATYSNYGVNSVWESVNGGTSWTSVEGNLPDMPVRWALFSPLNPDEAMIATEMGVWTTDNLNGGATVWYPANTGLANTRTDMLQIRTSDNLVVAATHGRGLFSTDVFSPANAEFAADLLVTYTGKPIQFTDYSTKAISWAWNFGDATTSTAQNPIKSYSVPGLYTVSLTINGGADVETKTSYLLILPNRGTPYAPSDGGNFDLNLNDFGPWNLAGTLWQRGNSAVAGKNGTFSGPNAWVTALTGNYTDNTIANLFCPNYNFTAPGTYTLRFRGRFNTENQYDGFNLEYSLDKGDNWSTLGTSGGGWYNFANAGGGTAFPAGVAFFTGNVSGAFNLYTRDVSFLAGNPNVAFRFVFKTDVSVTGPGVAVDDFEILGPVNISGLPISASPLAGEWVGEQVGLDWISYQGNDSEHFFIERSQDGRNFIEIGSVAVQQGIHGSLQMQYTDAQPGSDHVWYRYRAEDREGAIVYSNIVELFRKEKSALEATVYPNPAPQVFTVWITGMPELVAELQLFNASGHLVRKAEMRGPDHSGSFKFDFSGSPLAAGYYFLRVVSGGKIISKRVQIVK